MEQAIVDFYEHYREEERFVTSAARRIEFLTTVRRFDRMFPAPVRILDCAAGTGAYAFYLAGKGHRVTATDLTPRHVAYMRDRQAQTGLTVAPAVLDATDMRCFADATFDVVLNMGAFYHLPDAQLRTKCIDESLRVLKPGGTLVVTYIPRGFLNLLTAVSAGPDGALLAQVRDTGALRRGDPGCMWTDAYYASAAEMTALFRARGLQITAHFAQDGAAPLFRDDIARWTPAQFDAWLAYHLSVCDDPAALDMSNHVLIAGTKET